MLGGGGTGGSLERWNSSQTALGLHRSEPGEALLRTLRKTREMNDAVPDKGAIGNLEQRRESSGSLAFYGPLAASTSTLTYVVQASNLKADLCSRVVEARICKQAAPCCMCIRAQLQLRAPAHLIELLPPFQQRQSRLLEYAVHNEAKSHAECKSSARRKIGICLVILFCFISCCCCCHWHQLRTPALPRIACKTLKHK